MRIPLLDRLVNPTDSNAAFRLRDARRADCAAVAGLWRLMMSFHESLDPRFQFSRNADREFEEHFLSSIRSRDSRIVVAEAGSEVVGYILGEIHVRRPLYPVGKYGFISDISVEGDWRRQGIGKALVKEMMDWFGRKGVTTIELFAADRSPVSRSFWASMGFTDFLHLMRLEIPTDGTT
jgi:ribosomal protein S18 acetylase RimI-like enzyme